MRNGKLRIAFGWILVILQIISLFGLNFSNMKIWNDISDTSMPVSSVRSDLSFRGWCSIFQVSREKFATSFSNLALSIESQLLSSEYLSIQIRTSLGAGDQNPSFSLFFYDLTLLISYLSYGIAGLFLLVSGYIAKKKGKEISGSLDILESSKAKIARILCALLATVAIFVHIIFPTDYYYPELIVGRLLLTLNPTFNLILVGLAFLLVFFCFFIGKRKTVLLPSAIILFALDCAFDSTQFFYRVLNWHPSSQAISLVFSILHFVTMLCYLVLGIQLYLGKGKSSVEITSTIGLCLSILKTLVLPVSLLILHDNFRAHLLDIPALIFSVIIVVYLCAIPDSTGNVDGTSILDV